MVRRLKPYLILAGLGLLFFAELALHPSSILYSDHSDLVTQYVPNKRLLVSSWRGDGEVPLWNPYLFGGTPFVHDPQVTAFYPPELPLYLLPEEHLGAAMSWLLVFHVIVAGCGTYAYARSQGLGPTASLVASLGYMFAGKWLLHLLGGGHYTFAPLAWLPLVLLLLEQAVRRAGRGELAAALLRATGAGALFGVAVLGSQPQLPFYAGLFLGLWTLGPALEQAGYLGAGGGARSWRRTGKALGRWLGLGTWAALWAVGLAAVQLLPTLEATRETTRFVAGAPEEPPLRTVVEAVVSVAGPPLAGPLWEPQGGLGVVWVMAAALAPLLCRGQVRFQAAVCLALVIFALGGGLALKGLPGFGLFRAPVRMFLIAALPVALLAGTTTQALLAGPLPAPLLRRCRRVMLGVLAGAGLCLAGQALLDYGRGRALDFHVYWAALLVTVPAALWLPGRLSAPAAQWPLAWAAVLLIDLWALAWPLVRVRPAADLYAPSACVAYLAADPDRGRVLDRDVPGRPGETPLGFALPLVLRIESERGYNSFDVHRFKEYVQFISDRDGPVPPVEGIPTFPINNLPFLSVKNKRLLDLLGTRYLVQPTSEPLEGTGWRPVETDESPRAFCGIVGGERRLPPYTVYKNDDAFSRAFVVPTSAPLPERPRVLAALKGTDFRRTVLLEGAPPDPGPAASGGAFRPATIREYRPNRVTVEVESDAPGYLVLADVWYPGWVAAVDGGRPGPPYRANFLFRAVPVPAGRHEVAFTFDPPSYRWGRLISAATLVLTALVCGAAAVTARRRREVPAAPRGEPAAASLGAGSS